VLSDIVHSVDQTTAFNLISLYIHPNNAPSNPESATMAPTWQRLMRFKNASGQTVYGDPTAFLVDGELPKSGAKAHLVEGEPLEGKVTTRVEEIGEILSPIDMDHVPIVPCIGLK